MSNCYLCNVELIKNYHSYGIDCECPKQGYKIWYNVTVDPNNYTVNSNDYSLEITTHLISGELE